VSIEKKNKEAYPQLNCQPSLHFVWIEFLFFFVKLHTKHNNTRVAWVK